MNNLDNIQISAGIRKMGTIMLTRLEYKLVQPNWGTDLFKYKREYPFRWQLCILQSAPRKYLLICTVFFARAKYCNNLLSSVVRMVK